MTQEGNIVLGEGGDESDVENVVSESENESNDDTSDDKDNTQMQVTPYNTVMSFARQVIWHGDKRKQHIEHKCHCRLGVVHHGRCPKRCCTAVDRNAP